MRLWVADALESISHQCETVRGLIFLAALTIRGKCCKFESTDSRRPFYSQSTAFVQVLVRYPIPITRA